MKLEIIEAPEPLYQREINDYKSLSLPGYRYRQAVKRGIPVPGSFMLFTVLLTVSMIDFTNITTA